jgi:hypothetical protein
MTALLSVSAVADDYTVYDRFGKQVVKVKKDVIYTPDGKLIGRIKHDRIFTADGEMIGTQDEEEFYYDAGNSAQP